jgi:hypothetical protein
MAPSACPCNVYACHHESDGRRVPDTSAGAPTHVASAANNKHFQGCLHIYDSFMPAPTLPSMCMVRSDVTHHVYKGS